MFVFTMKVIVKCFLFVKNAVSKHSHGEKSNNNLTKYLFQVPGKVCKRLKPLSQWLQLFKDVYRCVQCAEGVMFQCVNLEESASAHLQRLFNAWNVSQDKQLERQRLLTDLLLSTHPSTLLLKAKQGYEKQSQAGSTSTMDNVCFFWDYPAGYSALLYANFHGWVSSCSLNIQFIQLV